MGLDIQNWHFPFEFGIRAACCCGVPVQTVTKHAKHRATTTEKGKAEESACQPIGVTVVSK